jgi:exonuclease SbcC
VASRVAQESDAEVPEELPAEWAAGLAAEAEAERAQAAAGAAAALAARQAAEEECAQAATRAERQKRRRDAEQCHEELVAEQPALDALDRELAQAERARPVLVAAAAVDARRVELDRRAAQEQALRAEAAALGGAGSGPADDLRRLAADGRTEKGRLESLREVAERAREAGQTAEQALARAESLAVQVAGLAERLAALPAERDAAEARSTEAQAAAGALPQAEHDLRALQAQADLAAQLEAAREQEHAATAEHERAEAEAARLREAADELRTQRFDAMIAELAAHLEDGTPGPVCGATEHPDVTEVPGGDVSREAERAAVTAAGAAATEAAAAGRRLAGLQERVALLTSQVGEPAGDLAAAAGTAAARVADLARESSGLPQAQAAVEALRREAEQLAVELARSEVSEREERKRSAEATGLATTLRARLAAELGEGVDLERRLHEVDALARAHEEAAQAADAATAAASALADAESVAGAQAGTAGFADVAAAREAERDESWRASAGARLEEHREALAGVRRALASDELAVALEPPAPVEQLQAAVQAARLVHEQAATALGLAADRAARLTALVPAYAQAHEALPPLEQEARRLRSLSELASGRGPNRLNMPLSTFVLAARLEEVAEAASLRLGRMSGERYTLVHTDASRDRRTRAGLGLQVRDAWTGRTRDTATLSGGETFMTALSLALGLADVVTAEAGGQTIDALFVDEGFGTLDADSLDAVMDVLDDLRSGGRLVGVVSHVADLRLRIPAQVHVLKGSSGSTVATSVG